MKKTNVILTTSLLAWAGLRAKTGTSVTSTLIEQGLRVIKPFPALTPTTYQAALHKSNEPYHLPTYAQKMGFKPWNERGDVFCITKYASSKKIVFFLHGGAYWEQPLYFHFATLKKLACKLHAQVVLPIYPKAPNADAIVANQMVLEVYQELFRTVAPRNIFVMGDSAGGGLALAMLEQVTKLQLPQPKLAILFSPWLDVATSDPRISEIQPNDHLLQATDLRLRGQIYAGKLAKTNPLVSPLYGKLTGLVPIYVFTGTHDILYFDALRLAQLAKVQKLSVKTLIYPKMDHDFILYPIPEARQALNRVVKIVNS
ncbi:alpha/beta hydrolase [Lactobacillus sp. ESL0681]|uniref:alpha/beta hydrolase fold domain-containing protein n=1 Tax=Lactobacillus sp. ESL0681 TaxID=2983211 RepID=UPI0023F9D22C|nr:alpha/beta hydrolase [Lactobacillus sp. ESL0681]WEV39941.1 alpha/beta hydrolase [Lactobacillus sp. ESL0681]